MTNLVYDEDQIHARLARLDRACKTAFGAACAERLLPLFRRYAEVSGRGDPDALEAALDGAWRAVAGDDVAGLSEAADTAESMVPSDEEEWAFEMGYAQNAAAAVAYVLRTWLTDSPQPAAWAARQLFEAADYAAQEARRAADFATGSDTDRLLRSAEVQTALAGLAHDLAVAESLDLAGLRERAREEGSTWARTLP